MTPLIIACLAFSVRDVRVAPGKWERRVTPIACSMEREPMRALFDGIAPGEARLLAVRDPNGRAVPLVTP